MVALIARRRLVYAGKRVDAGGRFHASERDAFLLSEVAKTAERAPVEPGDESGTRAAVVETPAVIPGDAEKRKRGRPRKVREEPPPTITDETPPATTDPQLQDEQAEGASPVGVSTGTLHTGRDYKRRDMKAED